MYVCMLPEEGGERIRQAGGGKGDNLWKTICDEIILQGLSGERAGRLRGKGWAMHVQFASCRHLYSL
jgi:hypothetical protein